MLDMFTTTPGRLPVSTIFRTISRTSRVAPVRFTASTASHCSRERTVTSPVCRSFFTSRPSRRMPALLTSAFSPPIALCAHSTKSRTSASFDTSSVRAWIFPVLPRAISSVSASPCGFTSPMATWAPAWHSRSAKWRPRPWAPPETMHFTAARFMKTVPLLDRRPGRVGADDTPRSPGIRGARTVRPPTDA